MGPGFLRSMTSSDETVVILNNKRIGYDDFPSHSSRWNVHLNTSEATEPSLSPHCIVPPKKRFLTIDLRSACAAGPSRPSPHTEPAPWQCWHTWRTVMLSRREGGMGGWRIGEGQQCVRMSPCMCASPLMIAAASAAATYWQFGVKSSMPKVGDCSARAISSSRRSERHHPSRYATITFLTDFDFSSPA